MKAALLILILFSTVVFPQVTEEWIRTYNGFFGVTAEASALDTYSNLYITGHGAGSTLGTASDFYTIKYNSQGILEWEATYDGGIFNNDWGYAIAVDPVGNVYVTGESKGIINGFSSGSDILTIKYDTQGNELWTQRYNGNNSNFDRPEAIAVDDFGNVFVTGLSQSSAAGFNTFFTLKYSTTGDLLWTARYGDYGGGAYGKDIRVDASGNVYVFGVAKSPSLTSELVTIKYNSTGTLQWIKTYSEFALGPSAMEIDAEGNVLVTGQGGSQTGFHTIKYSSSGDSLWCAVYNGAAAAKPNDITLDVSGNVYVTGNTTDFGFTTIATVKYNSLGQEQWAVQYEGTEQSSAEAISLDADGNVYVTGHINDQNNMFDFVTVKYNTNGVEQWDAKYNRPPDGSERAIRVHINSDGAVYVVGRGDYMASSGNPPEIITIKYAQSPSDVTGDDLESPVNFNLGQNYPNPFNPSTRIQYQVSSLSQVSLKVYDLLGREMAELVSKEKPAGTYEVTFDASGLSSGVYYYRITAGDYSETKKMVLLR